MVRILKAAVSAALLVAPMAQALQAESCLLVPSQSIELSSPVPGVVSRSELERGAQVTEGQILVRLDDRQIATIALAQAGWTLQIAGSSVIKPCCRRIYWRTKRLTSCKPSAPWLN